MNYKDDFERFAHDIINVVQGTGRNGSAQQWQIDKVADMLRTGPGITTWPRDAAEAAQRARDKLQQQRRAPPALLMKLPALAMPPRGYQPMATPSPILAPPKKP